MKLTAKEYKEFVKTGILPKGKSDAVSGTEYDTHKAVVAYIRENYPFIRYRSDLSGVKLHRGTVNKMSSLNDWPGFPDIIIFESRHNSCGLAIELKREGENPYRKDGKLKSSSHLKEQASWLDHLLRQGFQAKFATGYHEAIELIDNYLKQK